MGSNDECIQARRDNEVLLSPERIRELFNYIPDTGDLIWRITTNGRAKAGSIAGCINGKGYRQVRIRNIIYTAHRLIWAYVNDAWPLNEIDHINGTRFDNRLCNLREATVSQNRMNCEKMRNNTSGWKGVSFCKSLDKWKAYINANKQFIKLGYFNCPTAAYIAYLIAAKKYHGEFAKETLEVVRT